MKLGDILLTFPYLKFMSSALNTIEFSINYSKEQVSIPEGRTLCQPHEYIFLSKENQV